MAIRIVMFEGKQHTFCISRGRVLLVQSKWDSSLPEVDCAATPQYLSSLPVVLAIDFAQTVLFDRHAKLILLHSRETALYCLLSIAKMDLMTNHLMLVLWHIVHNGTRVDS